MGRTALKWLASIGAGGLTTLVLALIVLAFNFDVTSARGAALVTVVGTVCTLISGWAVSKYGPTPPNGKISASRTRKPRSTGNGPNRVDDLREGGAIP